MGSIAWPASARALRWGPLPVKGDIGRASRTRRRSPQLAIGHGGGDHVPAATREAFVGARRPAKAGRPPSVRREAADAPSGDAVAGTHRSPPRSRCSPVCTRGQNCGSFAGRSAASRHGGCTTGDPRGEPGVASTPSNWPTERSGRDPAGARRAGRGRCAVPGKAGRCRRARGPKRPRRGAGRALHRARDAARGPGRQGPGGRQRQFTGQLERPDRGRQGHRRAMERVTAAAR